ncbi:hypothetical protein [Streptomyces marincola]|uniref:hypothetical protein n=1 Tax=Streptomyces marincola TaxID=2878388 RepID=UPI00131B02FD|nr:hypothetical protein [Streptomyces marincola]
MTRADALPEWMPGTAVRSLPCGRWWDGVRVPSFVGMRVVDRLRDRSGPIIEDQVDVFMTWLVPVAAADGWRERMPGIAVLRAGDHLAVPPADWTGGPWAGGATPRWLIRPAGTCLTAPADLRAALEKVLPRPRAHDV